MGAAPCGCAMLDRARTTKDPRGRRFLEEEGRRLQRAWRCPMRDGADADRDDGELDPDCQTALREVESVIPSEGAWSTCPNSYTGHPDVYVAADRLRWWRKGQLEAVEPNPSGTLVDAIDVIERALAQREADELRRIRERAESQPQTGPREQRNP